MTNTKPRTCFILLPLLMLACSLTAQSAANETMPLPEQTATASPTLSPAPKLCQVKTGIDAGMLNLRTCGGIDCPLASVLLEGETVTQTKQEPVNEWIQVTTAGGLRGWLNSNYTDCEVTK